MPDYILTDDELADLTRNGFRLKSVLEAQVGKVLYGQTGKVQRDEVATKYHAALVADAEKAAEEKAAAEKVAAAARNGA